MCEITEALHLLDILVNFRIKVHKRCHDHLSFGNTSIVIMEICSKTTKIELELLTDVNMILDYENGVKSKITRALHYYAERNNKYMNNNNKSIENSHNAQLGFHIQYE